MPYLFCNIAWMDEYRGDNEAAQMQGGGAYVDANHHGNEACNFYSVGGVCYGYVRVPGRIGIDRFGVDRDADRANDITVVWVARHPQERETLVVGWYLHATVYRNPREFEFQNNIYEENDIQTYRISAEQHDTVLLPVHERNLRIPRGNGGFGQSNIWYADGYLGEQTVADVDNFIINYHGGHQI
ncbi:MAG: hypothetical protein ACNI3A_18430 [Desulfovibrio sp.]|uniref:hypothetical protein n=1 Tax=Desulfovibrio sp. 7SRBS1 TaxID=3378064 RepID=UPI003B42312A